MELLASPTLSCHMLLFGTCLVMLVVKKLPIKMQVQSLGWEDPLVEGLATHSSFLAQRIPWTEKLGRPESIRSQRIGQCSFLHATPYLQGQLGAELGCLKRCRESAKGAKDLLRDSLPSCLQHCWAPEHGPLSSSGMTRSLVTPDRRKTIIRTTSISFAGKEEGHILKLEKQEGSGLQ